MRTKDEVLRDLEAKRAEELRQGAAKRAERVLNEVNAVDKYIDGELGKEGAVVTGADFFGSMKDCREFSSGDEEEILKELKKRLALKGWSMEQEYNKEFGWVLRIS